MSRLKIEFTEDWQEVESCETAPALLAEVDGRLFHFASDLAVHYDFGQVGPVDCPIAYDAHSKRAYRYVSSPHLARRDYSELRAFDLETQASKPILQLPLNQWVLWQLEWIEGPSEDAGQLFGLLAADRPADDRVVIEHRLFVHNARNEQLKMRPLCRDAYRPLAFNRKRRELIFSGAEGIYLVNLRGVRVATMPQTDTTGHGASFDPSGAPRAVLGGDGIFIWDFESSKSRRLTRAGRNPVWDASRNGIWYQESSSDLYFFDLDSGESTKVFDVQGNRNPELWYSRPVKQTKCGRYLAVAVTAKKLKGLSRKANATGSRERVYVHEHALYILDLEQQVYWSREGFMNQMCWVE